MICGLKLDTSAFERSGEWRKGSEQDGDLKRVIHFFEGLWLKVVEL